MTSKAISFTALFIYMAIEVINVLLIVWRVQRVPCRLISLRVEQQHVMDMVVLLPPLLRVVVRRAPLPNDLAAEAARAEKG